MYVLGIMMNKCQYDLYDWLSVEKPLSLKEFFPIFKNAILGVVRLHGKCIVHRDIKTKNLMRTQDGNWIICDFGECRNLTAEKEL